MVTNNQDPNAPRVETSLQAAEAGRIKYLAPQACEVCGFHVRYTTTSGCVECTKRRAAARRLRLREKIQEARVARGE